MLIILHSNNFFPLQKFLPKMGLWLLIMLYINTVNSLTPPPQKKYINFKLQNITYVREMRILEAILHV